MQPQMIRLGELRDRAREAPILINFQGEEYLIYMPPSSNYGIASRPDGTDFIDLTMNSLDAEVYVVDEFNLLSDLTTYAIFERKL